MRTITLQGEESKFHNLFSIRSRFDADRLPYEVETRVYVVDSYNEDYAPIMNDDDFMTLAEEQGRVYTLLTFQEAFNNEDVSSSTDVIRIIDVPKLN